jgi:hypothetical protein
VNITSAIYSFSMNKVIVKSPFEIQKETEKCYFTKESRYLKSEIGTPILKSPTIYPYIELVMIDTDEDTLRQYLAQWFFNKANEIDKI